MSDDDDDDHSGASATREKQQCKETGMFESGNLLLQRVNQCGALNLCRYNKSPFPPNIRCIGCGYFTHARFSRGTDGFANRVCLECIFSHKIPGDGGGTKLLTPSPELDDLVRNGSRFLSLECMVLDDKTFLFAECERHIDGKDYAVGREEEDYSDGENKQENNDEEEEEQADDGEDDEEDDWKEQSEDDEDDSNDFEGDSTTTEDDDGDKKR